jgi:alkaline phosphatase D
VKRRDFLALAAVLGASAAWSTQKASPSRVRWRQRSDRFPEGVASGDPQADSVILWTRCPGHGVEPVGLTVEVARDAAFRRVVSTARVEVAPDADWTCRVLVGGLQPATEYWYRFTDAAGEGSRVGRTVTAPAEDDSRPVRFAFVSCQNVNQGAQHAYRRMIFEDERAVPRDRLGFVLHLGDFIYELVWYPEDRPQGMYDRRLRDVVRYADGEKIRDFHIPTTVNDYRAVYRAYLHDPDIQDARARFPFVPMWDNHEFSWLGWQGIQIFGGRNRPAQAQKVAANQAWFEYQPARIARPGGASLERFDPPAVTNDPVERFDAHGLGQETNNLAAIASLRGYRALRFGRNVELLITDQHSYRSEEPSLRPEAAPLSSADWPDLMPEEALAILDAGRSWNGGRPPDTIRIGGTEIPNFRKDLPPQTILGAEQKAWFLERLAGSRAVWKVWGNSQGTLDMRADPQHLPPGPWRPWPVAGYASFGGGDYSGAFVERSEICDFVRSHRITGFATVSGDRHSFWAGLAAGSLPPRPFEPVGIAFITGSISAPGLVEAQEHSLPADHPLRFLYLSDRPGAPPEPAVNLLLRHGVQTCLEYQASHDLERARARSDRDLAPHLAFVDMGGHGYATVRASSDAFETEFVCIPRPLERNERADGGPLRYRVTHRARRWAPGEAPRLESSVIEGVPPLAI